MSTRFCPDISELVAKENCEYCDKYRHWPEGTDDEPKECWYDWEAAPKPDKHGDEEDDEDE
ncbi:MAG: hypothetical protein JW720_07140 [Sedimentisphaerales bacterium]|nr:hypothetical protein [Sedimentisphaerales bacterium]